MFRIQFISVLLLLLGNVAQLGGQTLNQPSDNQHLTAIRGV